MGVCATCGEPVGPMLDDEGFLYVARCRCGHSAAAGAAPRGKLVRCADCDERIAEAQWDRHTKVCRGKVTCSRCGTRISAPRIREHYWTCGTRPPSALRRYAPMGTAAPPVAEFCAWCHLLIPLAELEAHRQHCVKRPSDMTGVAPPPPLIEWRTGQDYTLVVFSTRTRGDNRSHRPYSMGYYQLWTRDGRSRRSRVRHPGPYVPDQAEYLTMRAALTDLVGRIAGAGREPGRFTLTVYSRREAVIHQLAGLQPCRVTTAIQPFQAVLERLHRFADVELFCLAGAAIPELFRATR